MFERILVGIKFSGSGRSVIQTGVELSKIHNSRLHILHVLDYNLKRLHEDDPELKRNIDEACSHFDREFKPLTADLERVKFECLPGDPAMAICRIARETEADLILLGCHQRPDGTPLVRVDYVGSTILEKSPCPVLLIPRIDMGS